MLRPSSWRTSLPPVSHPLLAWVTWWLLLGLVTIVLFSVRREIDQAHVALTYLLVVLGGSVSGGRALGLTLAGAGFVLINYVFQQPFDTLAVSKPLDWIVLLAFLATAVATTELLSIARAEAQEARRQTDEVRRLTAEASHAEALREANHLKDVLLASVSHDLRTPLTTIKALAHDIACTGDSSASMIEVQADRLNQMVASLLDLSRIQSGSLHVVSELNTAEDLIGAAIADVQGIAEAHTIVVDVDWTRPELVGMFDFTHSLRVLSNLLENAIRYSPQGSTIVVGAVRDGAWLEFRVADRGMGIPVVEIDQVFEAFYRGSAARPQQGGAGLGLAIARRLAEAQGGSLSYQPRASGGSVFVYRVPATDFTEAA
ncbi:MAG TPA: ATP-binding protein [Gemmatimonadaceae bacterium]|jgi:K+-sensing histidine kinase KdpD|nr:ATP-binding protein [Gemmatimonadaceae bacterium]